MRYTTLSIRKHNHVRKYILFYADYLQEAWLSEVKDDEKTTIVKQFKCKDTDDLENLIADISRRGEVVNLASNETIEQHLSVLHMNLEKPKTRQILDSITANSNKLAGMLSGFRMVFRTYRTA